MSAVPTLAGAIELRTGAVPPQVVNGRPALAGALVRGRPAAEVPERLAQVFALCGGAHRLVARRAIEAAQGQPVATTREDAQALRLDTLREQLRRIWLDWPAALARHAPANGDVEQLRDCPVLRRHVSAADALAAMGDWLERYALGMPAPQWLAGWQAAPADWLDRWSRQHSTLPARLLAACRDDAWSLVAPPRPLRLHADAAALRDLADRLRRDAAFARAPVTSDGPRETGPWTRAADPQIGRYDSAWLRLGARLADAARLVCVAGDDSDAGPAWLQQGALDLGAGVGLAWCEMARGLLVHRATLATSPHVGATGASPMRAGAAADEARIADYDVVAPTEWNFHPAGVVAQSLAAWPADAADDDARVRLLAATFDPCVEVRVGRRTPQHAAAAPSRAERHDA